MYDFIKLKEEDPNKIYTIIQKIHSTNNKFELYKVKNKKTGEIFAAKLIKDYINIFSEKIKSLKKFESPYIVQFYQSYNLNNIIWVITEFVDCGSALDIMKITNKCYKEQEIASIIVMVLKGLQYLHLQKKYHGAVKPSNILINNEGVVKLSDYNTSNLLLNLNNLNNNNNNNNFFKSPPELQNKNNYSIKSDIWYLGLTCIELAEGNSALNNNKEKKDKKEFKNNNLWSLEFIDFIQKCLNENPLNRPSAAALLSHPFIINNNKGKIIIKKKINSIKTLIDIYREKIDEQEEKINLNENIEIRKNSLEITSFNENLSLSQSDDKTNNISPNMHENKSILNNNKDSKEKDKKNKMKKIKISIKNAQIQNNKNNNLNKANGIIKKNRNRTNSKKKSKNKNSSLKNNKITSFEIYEKIKNHNKINNNMSNGYLHQSKINNKNLQKKRNSMINKYIKNNNKISKLRNDIFTNSKINNTQENIYPKNNLMKLLNKFNHEKIFQNKNVNKSQRIGKMENIFILTESPNNKKIKHKYNYSIKITSKNNMLKDKKTKDNKSLSSIDSLRNSNKDKNIKNNISNENNSGKINEKKIKSKTRNKKSNGGNQNLSELMDSNKYGRRSSQKKNIMLRNLILNNSGKNIITEDNMKMKDTDNSKYNLNDKNNNYNLYKLNNSTNINNNKNNTKKNSGEYKFSEVNIKNLNKNSKTPNVYYFKSGEIKKLKRPPLSHSSRKNNFSKKIKQTNKKNHKINITDINNTNNTNSIHNNTNISIKDEDKSDYVDIVNNTNYTYTYMNNTRCDNQSFSYNRNDKTSLTEEELKSLCLNEKLNKRVLPELITELAGLENKMNHEIQKVKEQFEPIIKQHKEGIKFLKQNPFLKNIKEYENYKNFIKTMKITTNDDMENRSISSSIHNLNKIKISFYQSNDIEELNISANKYIFDKTGVGHHSLMKI